MQKLKQPNQQLSNPSYPQQQLEDLKMKIIIVGDSGVGKTNLRMRFCHGDFDYLSQSTVGIQFSKRKFWAPIQSTNNRLFTICLWDAAGKPNDNELLPSFFKNIVGVIYVFDITKQQTLQNLRMWKSLINDHLNVNKVTEMMIGNKIDLIFLRQVLKENAENLRKQLNIPLYFEISAQDNININDSLLAFITLIAKQSKTGLTKPIKLRKAQKAARCFY